MNNIFGLLFVSMSVPLVQFLYLCVCSECFYLDPLGMGVGFPATHLRPWNVYFAN